MPSSHLLRYATLWLLLVAKSISSAKYQRCFHIRGYKCDVCYKSLAESIGVCSEYLSNENPCLMYSFKGLSTCTWCKNGLDSPSSPQYGLVTSTGGTFCKKILQKINGCAMAIYSDSKNTSRPQCLACQNGYPALDGYSCVADEDTEIKVDNCLWGTTLSGGDHDCLRCVDGFTYDENNAKCVVTPSKGCMHYNSDAGSCTNCDVFEGYFNSLQGGCFSNSDKKSRKMF